MRPTPSGSGRFDSGIRCVATKGTTSDGLPKRDREQGKRDISEQRLRERQQDLERTHGTFDVPQRDNPGHPDGYRNNR